MRTGSRRGPEGRSKVVKIFLFVLVELIQVVVVIEVVVFIIIDVDVVDLIVESFVDVFFILIVEFLVVEFLVLIVVEVIADEAILVVELFTFGFFFFIAGMPSRQRGRTIRPAIPHRLGGIGVGECGE